MPDDNYIKTKPDFEFALPLINALQDEMKAADDFIQKERIIIHASSLANEFCEHNSREFAAFLNLLGETHYYNGLYSAAMCYYQKALDIQERVLGFSHLDTAESYNNIGVLYSNLGKFDKSFEYLTKALIVREKLLGPEHIETAMSFNSIGVTYIYTGNYDKALEYLSKAVTIQEKL